MVGRERRRGPERLAGGRGQQLVERVSRAFEFGDADAEALHDLTRDREGALSQGQTRRRELLKFFGSVDKLKGATVDQIAAAPAMNRTVAASVHKLLHGGAG